MNTATGRITARAVVVGLFFTVLFAILTVYLTNRPDIHITANQIPVLPYVLLLATVFLINPVCSLSRRIRPFSAAETLVIFTMGLVSAGISTFGLSEQLVPVVGSLFNRHWNNDQTEWNRYVEPNLNESYFLSVPGIRESARRYGAALAEVEAEQARYSAAAVAAGQAADDRAAPACLAALQARRAEAERARADLAALEAQAQDKVDAFRRGLPPSLRAYPGFLPIAGEDDASSYLARIKRLVVGRRALLEIQTAIAGLDKAEQSRPPEPLLQASAGAALTRAIELLEQGSDPGYFAERKAVLEAEESQISAGIAGMETDLAALHAKRRSAIGGDIRKADAHIAAIDRELENAKKEARRKTAEREIVSRHLAIQDHAAQILASLRDCRCGLDARAAGESKAMLEAGRMQFRFIDASFKRFLIGDAPWKDWIGPLWRWMALILLSYIMLFTFNVLIFRQWAYNEKLIYPLAQLPELLAGHGDRSRGILPEIFRSHMFWTGFAISGFTLGWNILCDTGAIPGLARISLGGSWQPYIVNTPLQGLLPNVGSTIFFTMVGLSFLIPTKVSFSLWFFTVLYMLQLLTMVGLNLGVNAGSFPAEWWYTFNFRTAEGGGALIVFSSVVLWKCRRYLLCAFMPGVLNGLDADERVELRLSSVLFLASIAGVSLILWKGMGAGLPHAIFCLFIILVITIGLVRAVAEGGILGFQAMTSPFHFVRTMFGMNSPATAPSILAPLMVYYSILFLDIKAFIAPAMANSLKIRDDLRISRVRFHALLWAAIALAALAALSTSIMMSYSRGADTMSWWFSNAFPKSLFEKIAAMVKTPPQSAPGETGWMLFGGGLMAALLYLRQFIFWLPHPIGFIMLVNPLMGGHWFSILVGWLAKTLVIRYGNRNSFIRMRALFVGFIAGELSMVLLAVILTFMLDHPIQFDLNR